MPTENRSSNTEQMVSVPRELLERAKQFTFDLLWPGKLRDDLQAVLAQPADQHQGEPVALPARKSIPDQATFAGGNSYYTKCFDQARSWNACLDEIARLGPLYTHPDAGEVERLRILAADLAGGEVADLEETRQANAQLTGDLQSAEQEVERLRADLESVKSSRDAFAQNAIDLRAQLAERDALLRDLVSMDIPRTAAAIERAKQILSASAEPNQCDGCQAGIPLVNGAHRMGKPGGYADTMSCQAGKYASAEPSASKCEDGGMCEGSSHKCDSCEPSAPVECDERADFERHVILATGRPIDSELKRHPVRHDEYECRTMQTRWNDWQARAALERKP